MLKRSDDWVRVSSLVLFVLLVVTAVLFHPLALADGAAHSPARLHPLQMGTG